VLLHNAPQPRVLLVSPSIRAEYLEDICSQGISATIRLGVYRSPYDTLSDDHKLCVDTLPAILGAQLRHATLLIDCGYGSRGHEHPNPSFWGRVNKLVNVLHEQAPTRAGWKTHYSMVRAHAYSTTPSSTSTGIYLPTFLLEPPIFFSDMLIACSPHSLLYRMIWP
jgi:hypothetical protein